jgi:hypothetical protein
MSSLIERDFLEVAVELAVEPSMSEVVSRVVGKTFAIELVLKMLECKCEVKHISYVFCQSM